MKKQQVIVRIGNLEWLQLSDLLFSRYPHDEWATFLRFGWREFSDALVLTLADIQPPRAGDLDDRVGHVRILEPYTLRVALDAEAQSLGIGVAHSHPADCAPRPSGIDDEMDGYYSRYFADFTPNRPYVSLILSKTDGRLLISGRVFWNNSWRIVQRFIVETVPVETWTFNGEGVPSASVDFDRMARFSAAFGEEASERLSRSTVAVIGAGGTGSMVIEVLARAGIGKLIIVDPDHLSKSNIERVHGSHSEDLTHKTPKVLIARKHVLSINPQCEVKAYLGSLPQKEIVDAVATADVAVGCTDQQHSRLALSDLSVRYLIPAIDCGVMLEGGEGKVTGQIIQLVRFLSSDPCALCRDMINPQRVAQELMSEDERLQRQAAAEEAIKHGENPDPYWRGIAQLNTVGYLTGAAGAMAAAFAIGWVSGTFGPTFMRVQMNLIAKWFDVQEIQQHARDFCPCKNLRGWADQGNVDALISAPDHWPPVKLIE